MSAEIRRTVRLLATWLLLCCLGYSPARAADSEDVADRYRALVDNALIELNLQHWSEARALFERAHALSPNAQTLRALGTTAFELRLYTKALNELEAALSHPTRPLSAEQRTEVEQLITQARTFVGHVVIQGAGRDQVLIDETEVALPDDETVLLDPGEHELRVVREDGSTTRRTFSLVSGETRIVSVAEPSSAPKAKPDADKASERAPSQEDLERSAIRERRRVWMFGLLAFAGASATTAGVTGLFAIQENSAFQNCEVDCDELKERGLRLQRTANVTAALAGASALSALTVWLTLPRSVALTWLVDPERVSARAVVRF